MFICIHEFYLVFLIAGFLGEQVHASILSRDCKTYHASKPIYTSRGTEYRASHGINCTGDLMASGSQSAAPSYPLSGCNKTTHCIVETYAGTIPAHSVLNISHLSRDEEHRLFKLIGQTPDMDFHRTLNGSFAAGVASSCLHLGQSGYIGAYLSFRCTEGVLSGCGGDGPVPDGTPVKACAPVRFGSEASLSFEFVNTTAAATANMTDDPILPVLEARAIQLSAKRFLWLAAVAMASLLGP